MINQPLVTILCITYNHAPFIEAALRSFLAQKTYFEYEILIHDDCSDDGTDKILLNYQQKYPDRIRVFTEEENQLSLGVNIPYEIMLPHVRGKYIACCEGDDKWIDPDKLQIQANHMESHPDCTLCCHNGLKHNCISGETTSVDPFEITGVLTAEQLIYCYKNNPPTASFFIRKDILADFPEQFIHTPVVDDVVRLYCMTKGSVWYIDRVMSYREFMHDTSWNSKMEKSLDLNHYYIYGMLEFYTRFDVYTEYKYHEDITVILGKFKRRFLEICRKDGKDEEYLLAREQEIDRIISNKGDLLANDLLDRKKLFDRLWRGDIRN